MPEKYKQALIQKLTATIAFLASLITYLSKEESSSGIEIRLLEHVQRLMTAYQEYKAKDRAEAYLIAIFERERRDFYGLRARVDNKPAQSTEASSVQAKARELFKIQASPEQCEELLQLAESEPKALAFLEWLADPPDEYLKGKPILSMKFVLGAWPRYDKAQPDDEELRRLQLRLDRQNAAMQSARGTK